MPGILFELCQAKTVVEAGQLCAGDAGALVLQRLAGV